MILQSATKQCKYQLHNNDNKKNYADIFINHDAKKLY